MDYINSKTPEKRIHIFYLLFTTVIYLCVNTSLANGDIRLETEYCMPRKVVVDVVGTQGNLYRPAMVSVYKCSGVVANFHPLEKKCVKNTSDILNLEVTNFYSNQPEPSYSLENHTSCIGQCVRDKSMCSSTQKWNPEQCRCECDKTAEFHVNCPEHYSWNPDTCQCVCTRTCIRRQKLNETSCSCNCKTKFYERCHKRKKLLADNNCTCVSPQAQVVSDPCDTIPTKWAVLIIILSFSVIFVLAFDCVLYGKKTGCIHNIIHLCSRESKQEEQPMNKTGPKQVYTEPVSL